MLQKTVYSCEVRIPMMATIRTFITTESGVDPKIVASDDWDGITPGDIPGGWSFKDEASIGGINKGWIRCFPTDIEIE